VFAKDRDLGENVVVIALYSWRSKTPKHSQCLRDKTYCQTDNIILTLTLILLTWRIWWAPNTTSRWQMGFNSAFKGL